MEVGGSEEAILKICKDTGAPIPQRIKDRPRLDDEDVFFLRSFYELSTTRSIGMAEGPISINAIFEYCSYCDYDRDLTEDIIFYVTKLDVAYLSHRSKKGAINAAPKRNKIPRNK